MAIQRRLKRLSRTKLLRLRSQRQADARVRRSRRRRAERRKAEVETAAVNARQPKLIGFRKPPASRFPIARPEAELAADAVRLAAEETPEVEATAPPPAPGKDDPPLPSDDEIFGDAPPPSRRLVRPTAT